MCGGQHTQPRPQKAAFPNWRRHASPASCRRSPTNACTSSNVMSRVGFPSRNNELERTIRALKTQYRRISGRKNWNNYLLRYGRCVAYAAWWEQDTDRQHQLEQRAAQLDRVRWREFRREVSATRSDQLKRFRFRHKRQAYLSSLEARWAAPASTSLLRLRFLTS